MSTHSNKIKQILRYIDDDDTVHGITSTQPENTYCGLNHKEHACTSTRQITCPSCRAVLLEHVKQRIARVKK